MLSEVKIQIISSIYYIQLYNQYNISPVLYLVFLSMKPLKFRGHSLSVINTWLSRQIGKMQKRVEKHGIYHIANSSARHSILR